MSEMGLLKQRIINVENDQKALKNKLDSWRNEANNKITELEKKLDEDIESRKNWEDAWVKVSNSYLKWNDELTKLKEKYESLNKDFLTLLNLIKENLTTPEKIIKIPKIITRFKDLNEVNSRGEKEVYEGTPSVATLKPNGSPLHSKPPELCKFYNKDYCEPCKSPTDFNECDLVKIGNQITVNNLFSPVINKSLKSFIQKQYKKLMEQQ